MDGGGALLLLTGLAGFVTEFRRPGVGWSRRVRHRFVVSVTSNAANGRSYFVVVLQNDEFEDVTVSFEKQNSERLLHKEQTHLSLEHSVNILIFPYNLIDQT